MVESTYAAGVSIPGMMTWFHTVQLVLAGGLERDVTVTFEYRRLEADTCILSSSSALVLDAATGRETP